MRTGTAISVFAHVAALIVCLVLAGVRPFEPTTAEAITVDIVTPEEAPPLPKEPDPTYDFPTLTEKPAEEPQPAPAPAPQQSASEKSDQASQQAALQQKEQPRPAEQSQQQPVPTQPQEQPEVPTAQPDITSRFGNMFAMPEPNTGDFDAKASASANIALKDAAALREHLKSCSILPRSISLSDDVRVVLRVSFSPDGRLAREPTTIEVKGAEKAPPLWRSAMDALKKCQPYAMLPADRYNEWRMLDLSFTPKDFRGG